MSEHGGHGGGHGGGESVGDFFVNLFFEHDEHGHKEAEGALHSIKEKIEELAKSAFAFNEITSAIHELLEPLHEMWEGVAKVAEKGHELETFSKTVGIATEELEQLGFLAKSVGVDAGTMNFGIQTLNRQLGEMAKGGGKEVTAAFHKLGISAKDAHGHVRNVGEVMPEVLEKFSELKTPAERAALAMDVFGRAGRELLPLLSVQSEKLRENKEDFEALGGAYSEELLDHSTEFIENTNKTAFAFDNMRRELVGGIMPALTEFIGVWLDFVRGSWPEIQGTLKSLGETIGDVFVKTAGTAFDTFTRTLGDVLKNKELMEDLKVLVMGLGTAFAFWLAKMNPLATLLTVGLVALEDYFGYLQGKDSLVGRISLAFHDWITELRLSSKFLDTIVGSLELIGRFALNPLWGKGHETIDEMVDKARSHKDSDLQSNQRQHNFIRQAVAEGSMTKEEAAQAGSNIVNEQQIKNRMEAPVGVGSHTITNFNTIHITGDAESIRKEVQKHTGQTHKSAFDALATEGKRNK